MVYLAIVSLLWAFSFGLIGSALSGVDPFFVATLRLFCATVLFLPFLRFGKIDGKGLWQAHDLWLDPIRSDVLMLHEGLPICLLTSLPFFPS